MGTRRNTIGFEVKLSDFDEILSDFDEILTKYFRYRIKTDSKSKIKILKVWDQKILLSQLPLI